MESNFDLWAIIELFGHQKIAGRVTEQNIGGTNMLRVDVPASTEKPAFTRFFGSAAIYAINPVDETTARVFAERLQLQPISVWDIREFIDKNQDKLLPKASVNADDSDEFH